MPGGCGSPGSTTRPLGQRWRHAADNAAPGSLPPPAQQHGEFLGRAHRSPGLCHRSQARHGTRMAAGPPDAASGRLYASLERRDGTAWDDVATLKADARAHRYVAGESGRYRLVLQPELAAAVERPTRAGARRLAALPGGRRPSVRHRRRLRRPARRRRPQTQGRGYLRRSRYTGAGRGRRPGLDRQRRPGRALHLPLVRADRAALLLCASRSFRRRQRRARRQGPGDRLRRQFRQRRRRADASAFRHLYQRRRDRPGAVHQAGDRTCRAAERQSNTSASRPAPQRARRAHGHTFAHGGADQRRDAGECGRRRAVDQPLATASGPYAHAPRPAAAPPRRRGTFAATPRPPAPAAPWPPAPPAWRASVRRNAVRAEWPRSIRSSGPPRPVHRARRAVRRCSASRRSSDPRRRAGRSARR